MMIDPKVILTWLHKKGICRRIATGAWEQDQSKTYAHIEAHSLVPLELVRIVAEKSANQGWTTVRWRYFDHKRDKRIGYTRTSPKRKVRTWFVILERLK